MYGKDSKAELKERCEGSRTAIKEALPVCKAVFPKFDGKVINKRLITALEAECKARNIPGHFWFEIRHDYFCLNYTTRSTLQDLGYNSLFNWPVKRDENGNPRFDAKEYTKAVNERYAYIMSLTARIEESMENIESTKEQLKYFSDKAKQIYESIPYEVRNIEHIGFRYYG